MGMPYKDFMFEINKEEFQNLRSQFVTSNWGGSRYVPMVFNEQGVATLSSVLNSERAILVNIEIVHAFTQLSVSHDDREWGLPRRSLARRRACPSEALGEGGW